MPQMKNQVIRNEGVAYDATNDICLGVIMAGWDLTIAREYDVLPKSNSPGDEYLLKRCKIKGKLSLREVNSTFLEKATGATKTSASSNKVVLRETHTISEAFAVTLGHGASPDSVTALTRVYGITGKIHYNAVTPGNEVAEKSYSITGAILTFDSLETETSFEIDYIYLDADAGNRLSFGPSLNPSPIKLYLTWSVYSYVTGAKLGDTVGVIEGVRFLGDITIGGNEGELCTVPFDYEAVVEDVADFLLDFGGAE